MRAAGKVTVIPEQQASGSTVVTRLSKLSGKRERTEIDKVGDALAALVTAATVADEAGRSIERLPKRRHTQRARAA